jgi:hypothetical protein
MGVFFHMKWRRAPAGGLLLGAVMPALLDGIRNQRKRQHRLGLAGDMHVGKRAADR